MYLSTTDAAALLACSPQTVRKLARTGRLPAIKIGRDFRIDSSSLPALSAATFCPALRSEPMKGVYRGNA